MNNKIIGRQKLRQVLASYPRRRFAEKMILDGLEILMPEPVSHEEFREWLEYNHGEGLIEYRFNKEQERDEWFLTDAGKQKEGL